MSRSNSKTVKSLREAECKIIRKSILKTNPNRNGENEALLAQLAFSGTKFEEQLAKLNKFSKEKKSLHKENTQKSEWMNESLRLSNLLGKIEDSILSVVREIIAISPELAELHDIAANLQRVFSQKQCVDSVSSQLFQLKEMVKEVKKRVKQGKDDTSVISAGVAIVADIIMKFRSGHSKIWKQLREEEEQLNGEIKSINKMLFTSLRTDMISSQNNKLDEVVGDILERYGVKRDDSGALADVEISLTIEEWRLKLQQIDEAFQLSLHEFEAEKRAYCASKLLDISGNASTGGWAPQEHDVFVKVFKTFEASGMNRKLFMETLQLQLPDRSTDDILEHEEWYRKMKFITQRRKQLEEAQLVRRDGLIAEATAALEECCQRRLDERKREEELLEHEKRRDELHQQLELYAQEKQLRDAMELLEKTQQEDLQRAHDEEREEQRRLEAAERKKQVSEYHERKQEILRRQQAALEEENRRIQEELRRNIEANKEKVALRTQQFVDKEQARRRKEGELKQLQEEQRLELLIKLAQQVPYFDAIQNAKSKLDHVTVSAKAHEYVKGDDPARGFIGMNGFTDVEIVRDARFRLATALRAAGVQHSEAARDAVAKFCPRPHLAIHGII